MCDILICAVLTKSYTVYQRNMSSSNIIITESCELPLTTGKIEVDTSSGAITIFMKSGPVHTSDEFLIITKTSRDNNTVSLFSETTFINGAEITMFGLPAYAKFKKGKIRTLVLKSDGTNWNIVREE